MTHALHHVICAVGLYRAGRAFTKRAQHGWLAIAAGAAVLCHRHHHHARR